MRVYRTSVKEDINVGNVFQHLAENYVHQWRLEQARYPATYQLRSLNTE